MAKSDITIRVKVVGVKQCIRTLLQVALFCMIASQSRLPFRDRWALVPLTWKRARSYARDTAKVGAVESAWWAALTVARLVWGAR
jgi:hypothetical protein